MEKKWIYRPAPKQAHVKRLQGDLGTSTHIATLLLQRGITSFDQAKLYFKPSLDNLHDPFLMKGMNRAVDRLVHAITHQEPILIYGDYDVDGVTSVSMLCNALKKLSARVDYYIPDRYKEGYGISLQAVEWAARSGFKLMISIDCGIRAVSCIQKASELGLDVVVCDHHEPGNTLPEAYAILNPKQSNCSYPFKELSGCGVGFKLLQGLTIRKHLSYKDLYSFLDLVAISIACDVVPLCGENRILAYCGLQKLHTSPNAGISTLLEVCQLSSPLHMSSIVFRLGPCINAAGRINHAHVGVQLLTSPDSSKRKLLAESLWKYNEERKVLLPKNLRSYFIKIGIKAL